MDWRIAHGVSHKACEAHGEMVLYVGFSGAAHVVGDLGYFIVDSCLRAPRDHVSLLSMALDSFEVDEDIDLSAAINSTVRQLHELGILAPCQPIV